MSGAEDPGFFDEVCDEVFSVLGGELVVGSVDDGGAEGFDVVDAAVGFAALEGEGAVEDGRIVAGWVDVIGGRFP